MRVFTLISAGLLLTAALTSCQKDPDDTAPDGPDNILNPARIVEIAANSDSAVTVFTYNAAKLPQKIVTTYYTEGEAVYRDESVSSFAADGQLATLKYTEVDLTDSWTFTVEDTYIRDVSNKVLGYRYHIPGSPAAPIYNRYTFDGNNRLQTIIRNVDSVSFFNPVRTQTLILDSFGYDGANHLTNYYQYFRYHFSEELSLETTVKLSNFDNKPASIPGGFTMFNIIGNPLLLAGNNVGKFEYQYTGEPVETVNATTTFDAQGRPMKTTATSTSADHGIGIFQGNAIERIIYY